MVSIFQGPAGAHWYVLHALGQAHHSLQGAKATSRLALGRLGDESAGWRLTRGPLSGETILFRQGRYVVTLTGAGSTRTFSEGQIGALARRQDQRLAPA
jgi:hypothetical protein